MAINTPYLITIPYIPSSDLSWHFSLIDISNLTWPNILYLLVFGLLQSFLHVSLRVHFLKILIELCHSSALASYMLAIKFKILTQAFRAVHSLSLAYFFGFFPYYSPLCSPGSIQPYWPEFNYIPPNPYVKALTPNVTVFKDKACEKEIKVKWSHKGAALIHQGHSLCKKRKKHQKFLSVSAHIPRTGRVRTPWGEGGHLPARMRTLPGNPMS